MGELKPKDIKNAINGILKIWVELRKVSKKRKKREEDYKCNKKTLLSINSCSFSLVFFFW